jgi:DNA-directed RNA polymerase specialized sigma24 family protein
MGARRGDGRRGPGLGEGPRFPARGKARSGRRRKAAAARRRLSLAEAEFYARVYDPARRGSLAELRRRGCDEQEAEELFAASYAKVMESVDPIEREFSSVQMVRFVKRACWHRLVDERRRRIVRSEPPPRPAESPTEQPGELAEERETVAAGREALAMLPERDRLIFLRRHLLGMLPEEIVAETPGLSMRTYRKIIQRANVRVLAAFERIEAGERCAEMEGVLLRRYVAGESPPDELRAIEAHLAHCRACGQTHARMRGYLLDVASGTLLASALGAGHAPPAHLLELLSQGAQALGEASRAVRERLRDAMLRLASSLPGPGADAGVSQALGASSWRIASACTAAVAAGACVAAGVVPGIGGVGLSGQRHHPAAPPARQAKAGSAPQASGPSEYAAPAPTATGSEQASSGTRAATAKSKATTASRERSSTATPASGQQVATEFGPESTQPVPSSGTSSPSSGSSQGTSVSSATAAKSGGSESGGSAKGTTRSSSEFGL